MDFVKNKKFERVEKIVDNKLRTPETENFINILEALWIKEKGEFPFTGKCPYINVMYLYVLVQLQYLESHYYFHQSSLSGS